MKIVQVAQSYPPLADGVSRVVAQLSEQLARRGHSVTVATAWKPGLSPTERINGVPVRRFGVRGNWQSGFSGEVGEFRNFVLGLHADVLVLHCTQVWTTDSLLAGLKNYGGARVLVSHGASGLGLPAYKAYYELLGSTYLTQIDRVIAISDMTADVAFYRSAGSEVQVIENGVDLSEWSTPVNDIRNKWGIGDRPWVLNVSGHSPVKGHHSFYRVIRNAAHEVRGLRGVQVGNPHYAERFAAGRLGIRGGCWYACQLETSVSRRIQLKRNVSRTDIVDAIRCADVFVLTSVVEASPLVILESMAAGTPWISLDVGSVRRRQGGVTVQSPGQLVEELVRLLRDPSARASLGDVGRSAVRRHDWSEIVPQYEHCFTEVSQHRRPG